MSESTNKSLEYEVIVSFSGANYGDFWLLYCLLCTKKQNLKEQCSKKHRGKLHSDHISWFFMEFIGCVSWHHSQWHWTHCIFSTDTNDPQDSRGKDETIFFSTLLLPPAHKHPDIHLQLCMSDDYHIFSMALLVFTRLLLDEIYHLIKLHFNWLMMWR